MRMNPGLNLSQFFHERFINGEAPCGIKDNYVSAKSSGFIDGMSCDFYRFMAVLFRVYRNFNLFPQHLQLFDRCRTVYVAGCQHGILALFLKHKGQFPGCSRLTCALKAYQHDYRKSCGGKGNLCLCSAKERGQFIPDNLDNCLIRFQAAEYFFTQRLFTDIGDELLSHFEINVRFQQ